MSTGIKAADIITVGGATIIHRLQTSGPGSLNINREKINELGNNESLAVLLDIPELSMNLESLDVTCATEALLCGRAADVTVAGVVATAGSDTLTVPASSVTSNQIGYGLNIPGAGANGFDLFEVSAIVDATTVKVTKQVTNTVTVDATLKQIKFSLDEAKPLNITGVFMPGKKAADKYTSTASAAMPYLTLSQYSYSFGVADKASQSGTLNGDSVYYVGGSTWEQSQAGTGAAGQEIVLTNAVLPYKGDAVNDVKYALDVNLLSGQRLFLGADYTEVATGAGDSKTVTITLNAAVDANDTVRVVYQSDAPAEYPQASQEIASATVPAAIKGKNVRVKVGGTDVTDLLSGVQTASVQWQVNLDRAEEMGNSNVMYSDYIDVPDVTGEIAVQPRDAKEFLATLRRIAGISSAAEVIGAQSTVSLPLAIELYSPEKVNGQVVCLKTLYIPDAKFTIPGYQGQVGQKTTVSLPYQSETGVLDIYEGVRP